MNTQLAMMFARLAMQAPQLFNRIKSLYNRGGYSGIPETKPFNGEFIQDNFPGIASAVANNYDLKAMNEDFLGFDNLTQGYGEDLVENNLHPEEASKWMGSQGWRNIEPTDSTEDLQNLYDEISQHPDYGNTTDALQSALIMEIAKRKGLK